MKILLKTVATFILFSVARLSYGTPKEELPKSLFTLSDLMNKILSGKVRGIDICHDEHLKDKSQEIKQFILNRHKKLELKLEHKEELHKQADRNIYIYTGILALTGLATMGLEMVLKDYIGWQLLQTRGFDAISFVSFLPTLVLFYKWGSNVVKVLRTNKRIIQLRDKLKNAKHAANAIEKHHNKGNKI